MNRREAKELNEFLDERPNALADRLVDVGLLAENVLANYRAGHIKAFGEGKDVRKGGEKYTYLTFTGLPSSYSVHEPEIDWAKAMKNGAWGEEFMFRNADDDGWHGPYQLVGYNASAYRSFMGKGTAWNHCKPVDGFEIPEEWLKDE